MVSYTVILAVSLTETIPKFRVGQVPAPPDVFSPKQVAEMVMESAFHVGVTLPGIQVCVNVVVAVSPATIVAEEAASDMVSPVGAAVDGTTESNPNPSEATTEMASRLKTVCLDILYPFKSRPWDFPKNGCQGFALTRGAMHVLPHHIPHLVSGPDKETSYSLTTALNYINRFA